MTLHPRLTRLALVIIAVWLMAGCAAPTSIPATGTPAPSATSAATERPLVDVTLIPFPTETSPPPTSTAPTTLTEIPTPAIDVPTVTLGDAPYLQDGGALPPYALARIGIGNIINIYPYRDQPWVLFGTATGLYVYEMPDFNLVWRRYLERSPSSVKLSTTTQRIETSYSWVTGPMLTDALTGERIAQFEDGWYRGAWSPDGRSFVYEEYPRIGLTDDSKLFIVDAQTGAVRLLKDSEHSYYSTYTRGVWSPDSTLFLACSDYIYVWEAATGNLIHQIDYGGACPEGFSYDNRFLFAQEVTQSPGWSSDMVIIELQSEEIVIQRKERNPIQWIPNGILAISPEGIRLYETNTWQEYLFPPLIISGTALSESGEVLAVCDLNLVTFFEVASFEILHQIPMNCSDIRWSPDESKFLVRDYPTRNTILDATQSYRPLFAFDLEEDLVEEGLTQFIDDSQIVTIDQGRAYVLDAATGDQISSATLNLGEAYEMGWLNNDELLLRDETNQSWMWRSGNGLSPEASPVNSDTLVTPVGDMELLRATRIFETTSPDGNTTVSGWIDAGCGDGPYGGGCGIWGGTLSITDETGNLILEMKNNFRYGPTSMAWTSDSRLLAVGMGSYYDSLDTCFIALIDPKTGQELARLPGHLGNVTGLIFSPDISRLASASEDGTVLIWNVNSALNE